MLRRNVLIFHSGALGDFVLSWPLAMALGRLFPQSRIICVCASQKGKLLERALRLESTDVENGWGGLFAESAVLPESIGKVLAGAHTICSFVAAAHSVWANNVRRLTTDATLLFIDPVLPDDFAQHASVYLFNQLSANTVIATGVEQILRSIAERGTGLTPSKTGPIVIHPGAGSPSKCWPLQKFREVAAALVRNGHTVQFIAGEVEVERWPATDLKDAVKPATLVELFDLLRNASAFIGNDSGPAHLAGIIGVPTIALFGPTSPANWQPLGPRVTVIAEPMLAQIGVEQVLQQLNGR